MGALEQLIQNEIDKRLAKSTLISSVPCKVVTSLDNEVYTVELITSKSRFDLVNYSGSPLSVGENVQVYYRGDTLTSQSGYIGASLTKGGDGGKDVYILGTKTLGSLTTAEKTFCNVAVKALKQTTITLGFNANILGLTGGDYVFKFYVDSTQYDYVVKGNDAAGKYENCHVILPISLDVGEHIIEINGSGSGTVEDVKAFVSGQDITEGNVTIRQKSGYTPLDFDSLSTSLIDWSISGAAGGVGKLGKNYLKPRLEAIPNGSIGILNSNSGWQNLINGCTFYTDTSTVLTMTFKSNSDSDIHPSDIADVMLIEGSTIPSTYNSETNLFIKDIRQGAVSAYDIHSTGSSQKLNQAVYATPDAPYNNTVSFVSNKRCYNYQMVLKPNTYYSIRVFNSTVNDIVGTILLINPLVGTITPTITSCSAYTQKSIPGNETFVANTEQWICLNYSQNYTREYYYSLPLDARPIRYEYCNYYATLKAGTYKVMIDSWGNNRVWGSGGYYTGIQDYTGCVYDNFNYDQNNLSEWFALVAEDNTVIISKSDILPTITGNKMVKIDGATPPLPNYFHNEVTFTIDHDCKVGLIHKAYYESQTYSIPAYHRFMIVDSDVEAEYFETTGADPAQMQGYSAWEKYQVTLPVTISCGDESQTITFDLGDEILYEGDSISKASTGVELPTYVGLNTITTDSENQPFVYIKYTGL